MRSAFEYNAEFKLWAGDQGIGPEDYYWASRMYEREYTKHKCGAWTPELRTHCLACQKPLSPNWNGTQG